MRLREALKLKDGDKIYCGECVYCGCNPTKPARVILYKRNCGCVSYNHCGNPLPFLRKGCCLTHSTGWSDGVTGRRIKLIKSEG